MDDLISRAAAIKTAAKGIYEWMGFHSVEMDIYIEKKIDALPAVDAVPVVHARWLYEHGDPAMLPCSACGYKVYRYNNTPYCPNCGAKMDGERRDEDGKDT